MLQDVLLHGTWTRCNWPAVLPALGGARSPSSQDFSAVGAEPTYAGVTMSKLMEGDQCVGDVISLLWFKRQLPKCVAPPRIKFASFALSWSAV